MKIKTDPREDVYYVLKKNVKAPSFFKDFGEKFKAELTPYPNESWYMRSKERMQRYLDEYSEHLHDFEIAKVTQRVSIEYEVE